MILQNEIALVTGGSRGIGRACCLALAKEGAEVIVNYHSSPEKAEEVVSEIVKAGGKASALKFDVSNPEEIETVLSALLKQKKISILVNNAGITRDNLLLRMKDAEWDDVIATNLTAIFRLSKACLKGMGKARWGRIIKAVNFQAND